jgi:hypothetical protein
MFSIISKKQDAIDKTTDMRLFLMDIAIFLQNYSTQPKKAEVMHEVSNEETMKM